MAIIPKYDSLLGTLRESDSGNFVPYDGATADVVLGSHDLSVDTDSLYVNATTHRVGIGTSSPSDKFEVYNSVISTLMSGDNISMRNHYTGGGWARSILSMENDLGADYFNIGGFGSGQSFTYGYIGQAYDSVAIGWDTSNRIGIGTAPVSNIRTLIKSEGTTSATSALTVRNSANSALFYIRSDGLVGIGNENPAYRVEVQSPAANGGVRSWMGFDVYPVPDPTSLTATLLNVAGNVDAGLHYYSVSYVTATGETHGTGTAIGYASVTTDASHGQVSLTLPISSDSRVTQRWIYRTIAGQASYQCKLLAKVLDNTTVTYVDNLPDSSLGADNAIHFRGNTTSPQITIGGNQSMRLDYNYTAFGYNASLSNTFGGRFTTFGYAAGRNSTTGFDNCYFGYTTGYVNTTGSSNCGFGFGALFYNTSSSNTGIGHDAMFYQQAGSLNTAVGQLALFGATTATYTETTGVGANAGFSVSAGANYDSFFGSQAGYRLTTAKYNTLLGAYAGYNNYTGDNQTAVGYRAGYSANSGSGVYVGSYAGNTVQAAGGVYLGTWAGYYETGANKLYIDNNTRASEADGRAKALVYGVFASTVNAQSLAVNGVLFPLQSTTAAQPAYVKGGVYFDTTLNKLMVGGATAWETVTSI